MCTHRGFLRVFAVVAAASAAMAAAGACGSRGSSARQAGSGAGGPATSSSGLTVTFESPALRDLIEEHWQWRLRRSPVFATTLGDHRYDDQLPAVAHGEILAEQ